MAASGLGVHINDRIRAALETALNHKEVKLTEEQRQLFHEHTTKKTKEISLEVVKELSGCLVEAKQRNPDCDIKCAWIHEIIAGSEIVLPPPKEGPKRVRFTHFFKTAW